MPREPRRVRVDLGSLALEVLVWPGSLPPVLALHGLAGNVREWDRMARAFDDLRVLAVDLRGHGSSDWADSYGVDAYVHDVEDVVERVHSGPVVVVGHSLGGIVGMSLGARRPDLVERLVMVDIGPELPASAVTQVVARRDRPTAFDGPDTAFDALRAANPFAPDDVIRDLSPTDSSNHRPAAGPGGTTLSSRCLRPVPWTGYGRLGERRRHRPWWSAASTART
jgi:pimeloyl-ACP methyl ester carboxylesterase